MMHLYIFVALSSFPDADPLKIKKSTMRFHYYNTLEEGSGS